MFKPLPASPVLSNNAEYKNIFIQHIRDIKRDALRNTAQRLCEIAGDWLFQCPGTYPAAPGGNHHEENGGLVLHLLGVEAKAKVLAKSYQEVDLDSLSFAALFHDFGKCYEFSKEGETVYAALGHVAIALMLIPDMLAQQQATDEEIIHISHMLASHHGSFEEGALVEPMTVEAHILAAADKLDANLWRLNQIHGSGVIRGKECTRLSVDFHKTHGEGYATSRSGSL